LLHRLFFFATITFALTATAAADKTWLATYKGKYSYDVVGDSRIQPLINETTSAKDCDGKNLAKLVFDGLSGPGEPVVVRGGQFVTVHACKAHACNEISMIWVDLKQSKTASAYADLMGGPIYVSSRDFTAKKMDENFKKDFDTWVGQIHWNGKKPSVVFCGASEEHK
jgi:hypothetical protein